MAMTAQQYLATLPPAEQQQVQASLASSGSTLDQWFQAAGDAGDPRAGKAAGGTAPEGAEGGVADFSGAAPSSEWLGKRTPTPRELRRWAQETGQSEDYARYDDRQVAAWLNKSWDAAGGHFTNDFGDVVQKPTESGPKSKAAGFATGEKAAGTGGGGGGAGKAAAAPTTTPEQDSLQAGLVRLLSQQGGVFAGGGNSALQAGEKGLNLKGGGVWGQPGTPAESKPTSAPSLTPTGPQGTTPAGQRT